MNDPAPRQRCSALARSGREPLFATAPVTGSWLLLEQPGPWGGDALTESSLDPEVSAELGRQSRDHGFKILLIRRSAGRSGGARSCFLVRAEQGQTWMERLEVGDPAELLQIDLSKLAHAGNPGIGEPAPHLWAVCTHGRRDPCCAEYGRRLVRLGFGANGLRENLWESSHQGGHRFAANLALFPHGLFYGMVEPEDAARIVDAYRDGRVVLDHYRGRSAFEPITQAADYLARREDSITGIDDLVPQEVEDLGDGRFEVSFAGPAGFRKVRLEVSDGPMRAESCNKPKLTPVTLYRELEVSPEIREFPTI